MSEAKPTSCSQEALTYYRRYRKLYPLPEGWTEEYLHEPEPVPIYHTNHVYLQNPEYVLQLRFEVADEAHLPGEPGRWADLRVIRKDHGVPTEEESLGLARLLFGVEDASSSEYLCLGGCTINDRPLTFFVGPSSEEAPGEHHALAVRFTYPPEYLLDFAEGAPQEAEIPIDVPVERFIRRNPEATREEVEAFAAEVCPELVKYGSLKAFVDTIYARIARQDAEGWE